MKIRMIKSTHFGYSRKENEVFDDVPDAVCTRWANAGIAYICEDPASYKPEAYDAMKPKALFDLCKARELTLEKEKINGKTQDEKKAYLISVLEADDARASELPDIETT